VRRDAASTRYSVSTRARPARETEGEPGAASEQARPYPARVTPPTTTNAVEAEAERHVRNAALLLLSEGGKSFIPHTS